ncbi:MAG: enamine deaminase RidA (YjgF/YER057c/UK114 family) [Gammaproteobacteria bacterium]|jgi:enamine deaminase RidA (YjgF/YER057c/UK114 family)
MIERIRGDYAGRSKSSAYNDLVWAVATADNTNQNLAAQTLDTLDAIESNLIELGSDKTRILSAQEYMVDIIDKPIMDEIWTAWIGSESGAWPQ